MLPIPTQRRHIIGRIMAIRADIARMPPAGHPERDQQAYAAAHARLNDLLGELAELTRPA